MREKLRALLKGLDGNCRFEPEGGDVRRLIPAYVSLDLDRQV